MEAIRAYYVPYQHTKQYTAFYAPLIITSHGYVMVDTDLFLALFYKGDSGVIHGNSMFDVCRARAGCDTGLSSASVR
jgi:hypothetical protein